MILRYRDAVQNLRTTFLKILDRAGIPRFERPFTNLRSSRVTELRQHFDPKVVSVWLGHSESISSKHYAQVRPEDFAAAVAKPVAPPVARSDANQSAPTQKQMGRLSQQTTKNAWHRKTALPCVQIECSDKDSNLGPTD